MKSARIDVGIGIESADVVADRLRAFRQGRKETGYAPEWQVDTPVICVAARGALDEAAAIMLAQLLEKRGLGVRVEGADAISTSNILRLETSGIVMVCLSCLDTSSLAHIRYTVRRVRRKLPKAQILVGCWMSEVDARMIRDTAKADTNVTTLRDAVKFCLEGALKSADSPPQTNVRFLART